MKRSGSGRAGGRGIEVPRLITLPCDVKAGSFRDPLGANRAYDVALSEPMSLP
jgi:hypothetical protein